MWGSYRGAVHVLGTQGFVVRAIDALAPVTIGALVYALACHILRVEELSQLSDKLVRRLRRR